MVQRLHIPHLPVWRRTLLACMGAWIVCAAGAAHAGTGAEVICEAARWPLWERFAQRHMQSDGRVVDFSVTQQHSTSEGQSYGMFFALVARDRVRFDRLWNWSIANLSGGKPDEQLPAWRWGQREDRSWGVLDANPASDANLWYAYALLEAARIWSEPRYEMQARKLLAQVNAQEVADLPGLGPTLLPAGKGFTEKEGVWRLNPSYVPVPLLRAFERVDAPGPWKRLGASYAAMLQGTTPKGFVADWVAYKVPEGASRGSFIADPDKGDIGSYDAIRTYLWAGMTPASDPLAALLKRQLGGMQVLLALADIPPEKIATTTAVAYGPAPVGYSAALLPYLSTRRAAAALAVQQQRVNRLLLEVPAGTAQQPPYYDQMLGLFGTGWMEQRYQFLPDGRLQLRWEKSCPVKSATNTL